MPQAAKEALAAEREGREEDRKRGERRQEESRLLAAQAEGEKRKAELLLEGLRQAPPDSVLLPETDFFKRVAERLRFTLL